MIGADLVYISLKFHSKLRYAIKQMAYYQIRKRRYAVDTTYEFCHSYSSDLWQIGLLCSQTTWSQSVKIKAYLYRQAQETAGCKYQFLYQQNKLLHNSIHQH
jgi:hypothetical protein